MKVSIVIVYFQEIAALVKSLNSIKKVKTKIKFETIVVDNSRGRNVEKMARKILPGVKYIKSPANLGYGAGNNLGVNSASGKYVFILNSDTEVLPNTIDVLAGFLDRNKNAAVAAPNLVDENRKVFPQLGSRRLTPLRGIFALTFLNKLFPNNPISTKYYLKDVSITKLREADAVPGAAFMIRKDVFEKVGRFDEKMFMYFEENDLGKRVREVGWKLFINPVAEVVHDRRSEAKNDPVLKKFFTDSRYYYFKKHFGLFWACLVELVARFSKWEAVFILILALGTFLRFYRIDENIVFHGELGHNYLAIKNFIAQKQIPLLGPPTSHPWISFGPLFYWFFVPVLLLANYNPAAGAYFWGAIGVVTILVNYLVVGKILTRSTALISTFLISISPAFVSLTREARFFSFTAFLFYPLLYFLVSGRFFLTGLVFGIMLNFHLSPIVLIPPILITIFTMQGLSLQGLQGVKKFLLGVFIPSIPFLLFNFENGLAMLKNFAVWIPYRILGFVGVYPKNNLTSDVAVNNLYSLYNFLGKSIFPEISLLFTISAVVIVIFLIFEIRRLLKEKSINLPVFTLLLFFFFGILGIFIHGDPPTHYYLPIYPILLIFVSILLAKFFTRKFFIIPVIVISFITVINFKYYFSSNWFYWPQDKLIGNLVPYKLQLEVAGRIAADANGKKYALQRVGFSDNFEGNFAQNYQYLLWRMGNEPAKVEEIGMPASEVGITNDELRYKIYEGRYMSNNREKVIFREDGVVVTKI